MSQAGTFIICSTVGIIVCSLYAQESKQVHWAKIGRDILFFPPFMAFLLAIFLKIIGYHHHEVTSQFLEKLGSPMSVAALLSIGLQMDFTIDKNLRRALVLGLLFKLILAPMLIYVLYMLVFQQVSVSAKVSVIGSCLGSMNTIGIVAIRKGLNPAVVTKLLAISIPLSLGIVAVVQMIL